VIWLGGRVPCAPPENPEADLLRRAGPNPAALSIFEKKKRNFSQIV